MTAPVQEAAPQDTGDFAGDCTRYARFWEASAVLLARLPAKPARNAEQALAAEQIKKAARDARARFLSAHAEAVYDRLTQNRSRFIRVEQLVYDAASLLPGLVPTRAQVAAESAHLQRACKRDGLPFEFCDGAAIQGFSRVFPATSSGAASGRAKPR